MYSHMKKCPLVAFSAHVIISFITISRVTFSSLKSQFLYSAHGKERSHLCLFRSFPGIFSAVLCSVVKHIIESFCRFDPGRSLSISEPVMSKWLLKNIIDRIFANQCYKIYK